METIGITAVSPAVSTEPDRPAETATVRAQGAVELRPLIVADAGRSWLDDQFAAINQRADSEAAGDRAGFERWLDYKRRSAVLQPETWLAVWCDGRPVGLAQGAGVARVFHIHFLVLNGGDGSGRSVAGALSQLGEIALRRRCHTLSMEGPNTGVLVRLLGPEHLVADGYTWHERAHLGIGLETRAPEARYEGVGPLRLDPEATLRLMDLEADAFLHAACDHPGELPSDLSDGYRTSLLPMQHLSAMFTDGDGTILGALYAEGKGRTAWIHSLFVEPANRQRGVARRLLDYCLDRHASEGFSRSELSVLVANTPAVHLYAAAGFREIKRTDLFIKKL